MENLRQKYQSKYQKDIASLLDRFELTPNFTELDISTVDIYENEKYSRMEVDLVIWKYRDILDSFIFGNSFIGNEYFILRYTVYKLLLYWYIIKNELLSNDGINACKLEIETQFYFYLNCIYNLKEKFEQFVNYQSKNKELENTILKDYACRQLLDIFNRHYKILDEYCKARSYIVHKTFSIQYILDKNKINVSCFSFKLTSDHIDKDASNQPVLLFDIDPENIIIPVKDIYELIIECLDIFRQIINIDFPKLMNKYISLINGKESFEIAF